MNLYVHNWLAAEAITIAFVLAILAAMMYVVGPAIDRLADRIRNRNQQPQGD